MEKVTYGLNDLMAIMTKLRDPELGCPWDLAQDFASIVPFTIEEAYEVADVIERGDFDELPGELGDLLFQVVFYSQLGKEQHLFDFEHVINTLCEKLIRRHPHVFNNVSSSLSSQKEVSTSWETIKASEREAKQQLSLLDDIPNALPALSRSIKIQKRVAKVGFDWPNLGPVVDKIHEEINEVLAEAQHLQQAPDIYQPKVEDEMGDLLFAVVNLARHLNVNPEQALRQANAKFERRFRGVEEHVNQSGRAFCDHKLEELDVYWDRVKEQEKTR